jgi:ABC-type transport system substrate-binding protein
MSTFYPTSGRHSIKKVLYLPKAPVLPPGPNPLPAYAKAMAEAWMQLAFAVQEFARQVGIIANREVVQRSGGAMTGGLDLTAAGTFIVPILAADPASPVNGQIWYNSTSNAFKGVVGGVVKTFTVS